MPETTWFITGASSGLGYALAEHVLKQGERGSNSTRSDPNSNRSRISPLAPTTRTQAKPYSDESSSC